MALLSLQQLAAQAIVILQKPKEEVALPADFNPIEIFLAGTIDMGKSIDWQVAMSAQFAEEMQRSFLLPVFSNYLYCCLNSRGDTPTFRLKNCPKVD